MTNDRRNRNRHQDTERRAQERVPIDLWMEEVHGEDVYFRRSCNLSEGGVLFEQSVPYPIGTPLRLRFTLPGGTPHETNAEVVSAAHLGGGLGMGLRFIELPDSARQAIAAHLQSVIDKRRGR